MRERQGDRHPTDVNGVKVRYGRLTSFALAVLVTTTALLGGAGLLPSGGQPSYAATGAGAGTARGSDGRGAMSLASQRQAAEAPPAQQGLPTEDPRTPELSPAPAASQDERYRYQPSTEDVPVPADSGEGRRVVFDQSQQRVWLVRDDGSVERTYLVSGSVTDNLDPGTYQVYSRSPTAVGIDDSGTMRFMVRFAHGQNAAIGFHDIPVLEGKRVQTTEELGTPMSHGCIRQWRPDAKALWRFAPLGTTVVVTA